MRYLLNLATALIAPLLVLSGPDVPPSFDSFIERYSKEYHTIQEYFRRKDIYQWNVAEVERHNSAYSEGDVSYWLEMNAYGDFTDGEYYHGFRPLLKAEGPPRGEEDGIHQPPEAELPSSFDWSISDAVTPIKNQGNCGSCWAFSTTGALEGLNYVVNKDSTPLSEQQLVDCSKLNSGCGGGYMPLAFQYAATTGICSEKDYPYVSGDGSSEKCISCDPVFTPGGCKRVQPSNETALQHAVYRQPVSIALEASSVPFRFYSGGVLDDARCGKSLNHGVLLVGWGELDGKEYWKVKNSWGEDWGDDGYILLARGIRDPDGECGLALDASFPYV